MNFGEPLLRRKVVTSTQDIARELVEEGAEPGTVVSADFQSHGRGRLGRTWYAPEGANVILTAIGSPVPAGDAWQISLIGGVAVAEVLTKLADIRAKVRFPNDVLVGGLKVAGILVETVPADTGFVTPLIGIGVNVRSGTYPPEVRAIATSLERLSGMELEIVDVERAVLRRLGICWDEWVQGGLAATLERWKPLADPEARRQFTIDGRVVVCRIIDFDADGTLTLEGPTGDVFHVHAAAAIMGDPAPPDGAQSPTG